MYGIVNKAIEDLVKTNFGVEKWEAIKVRSGLEIEHFISSETYDDDITYLLAGAAAAELGMSVEAILQAFGEWWVLKTSVEKYGSLMEAGGSNLKEFLVNLPVFHNRIMFVYPKLTPPEFRISHIEERGISVHYFSKRHGLRDFVYGLLIGLGKMYQTPVVVELIQSREEGSDHEIFRVTW